MENIIDYFNNKDFQISFCGVNIKVINFAKLEAGPNWSAKNHCHTYYEFHLISNGRGYINIEGTELTVNKNDFYITGPYVMHSQVSDKEDLMEEYCLKCEITIQDTKEGEYFNSPKDNKLLIDTLSTTYPKIFNDYYGAITTFEEIIKENNEQLPGFTLKIQALMINLIINLFRGVINENTLKNPYLPSKSSLNSFRVNRIINFIENNYNNAPTINDITNILFLSSKQINRIMTSELNTTFHDYLLDYNIKIAKNLLINTDLSIEAIALESGFSSHYYMYQVFKRKGLSTPASFRQPPKEYIT